MSDEERQRRYPNVVRAIAETPWAILPERLALILEIIQRRAAGERFDEEEIRERIGGGPASRPPSRQGTVAVLPLYGVLIPRASVLQQMSGGTGLVEWQDAFRQAVADPQVDAILIDVDSPGGSVALVPETAAEVRNARGKKPVVAIANTMAASAAYYIASQAGELVVTPSGTVGSIGVIAAHEDISRLQTMAGIKTTLIRQPAAKADTNPFEPLTEEARQALQDRVDEIYGTFVRDVARGRGVSVDAVREGFGQGRVVSARNALDEGMVDRIDTFEATLARLLRGGQPAPGPASATPEQARDLTPQQVQALASRLREIQPVAGPVRPHSTDVVDEAWDGPGEEAKLSSPVTKARGTGMYAWYDETGDDPDGDGYPDAKDDWAFPHHKVTDGEPGPANVRGVRNALQRLPQSNIPEADHEGVRRHLQRHLDDFNRQSSAAESGLSFAGEAAALRDSAAALVDRLTSLAEVERGSLTAAKREQLLACPAALRDAASAIDAVLAATDPHTEAGELALIRARANPNL